MKYCSDCGAALVVVDAGLRRDASGLHCAACGARHAPPSPQLLASCIADWHGAVLLLRSAGAEPAAAAAPRRWCLPASRVGAAEPLQAAAIRAAREAVGAIVDEPALFRVYNLPQANEVVAVFRGTLREGRYAGAEADVDAAAAQLFAKRDLPWSALAREPDRAALHDFATRRWQPAQASPVEDLVWLQPPRAAALTLAAPTSRRR